MIVNLAKFKGDCDPIGHSAPAPSDPMFSTVEAMANVLADVRFLLLVSSSNRLLLDRRNQTCCFWCFIQPETR